MRRKAYGRILVAATMLTLVATTIAPDVIAPFFHHPLESASVLEVERQIFECIAWPPQVAARALDIWIDGHSAQLWPSGWPLFAAFATRLFLISVPFWFLAGLILFELARAALRVIRSLKTKRLVDRKFEHHSN